MRSKKSLVQHIVVKLASSYVMEIKRAQTKGIYRNNVQYFATSNLISIILLFPINLV